MQQNIKIRKPEKLHKDPVILSAVILLTLTLIIIGVAITIKKIADWGAGHQIIGQRVVDLKLQYPIRIEEIVPEKEIVIVNRPYEDLTTTEQKIIEVWKDYKTAMLAISIFECESGLYPEAVSATGDLGVAQINWVTWKGKVEEEFGYSAIDMFDVDKNLEVAYYIWDRADGTIDGKGSFEPWSVYTSGAFLNCLE